MYRRPSTTLQNVLKNGQDKTPKESSNKRSNIEYSKSLRICSGNQAKMLIKGHLGIKCHSQYIKVTRLLQHSSANRYWGDWGCIVNDLKTIIVLVLHAFNFDGVGLAGFKSIHNGFFTGLSCSIHLLLFFPFSSFPMCWYCGSVVFRLIGCKSLSPSLALPTSFNN